MSTQINLEIVSEDDLRAELRRRHPTGRPVKWGPCRWCGEEFSAKGLELHEPRCDERAGPSRPDLAVPRKLLRAAYSAGRTWALHLGLGSKYVSPETLSLVYRTKQEQEAFALAAKGMLKKRGVLTNGGRVISLKPIGEAKVNAS